jgi:DNA-binding NtrC family response regulator
MLLRSLSGYGWDLQFVQDPETAIQRIGAQPFDLVITDFKMAKLDGMELLARIKEARPDCEVVLISGYPSVEVVRRAFKLGAADFLQKPFSPKDELVPLVRFLLGVDAPHGERTSEVLDGGAGERRPAGFVCDSAPMQALLARARKVARADATVLLQGESGSGKGEVAGLIHATSPRHERPFVRVNCAAIPDTLIESELFGHARGAFTGAERAREGLFQAAEGGTLFLDEVGEMPLHLQPKLLRALEQGEFHRIGDPHHPIRVDVRVVAATNRDLESMVREGTFREDLYYRLNVVTLRIPPLRERPEDLDGLIEHFLRSAGYRGPALSEPARRALHAHDWPGNVRELRNALEHAMIMAEGRSIDVTDLPDALQHPAAPAGPESGPVTPRGGTLAEIEVRSILDAMSRCGYNQTRAARMLGITRRVMGYRIKKYGLAERLDVLRREDERRVGRGRREPDALPPRR